MSVFVVDQICANGSQADVREKIYGQGNPIKIQPASTTEIEDSEIHATMAKSLAKLCGDHDLCTREAAVQTLIKLAGYSTNLFHSTAHISHAF